jgi:hypothetical protein
MTKTVLFSGLALAIAVGAAACGSDDVVLGGDEQNGDGGPRTGDGSAGEGGSQTDAASDAGQDAPLVPPPTFPRLVLAHAGGVAIWNNVDKVTTNVAPSAKLATADGGVTGQGLGLGWNGDTLWVAINDASRAILRYANASALTDGAMPTSTIANTTFGGPLSAGPATIRFDSRGNVFMRSASDVGSIHLVTPGATAATAHFRHPTFQQIVGMAYDETGNKLIAGQISGAGLMVWNNAVTRTGEPASDYQLAPANTPTHLTIAGGRLYETHFAPSSVRIWNGISAVTGAKAPDLTLSDLCGTTELRYSTVIDDTLIVLHNGGGSEKVCLYRGAAALTATRAPDAVATDASLVNSGNYTDKAFLSKTGHLYVQDKDGVAIFKNATGPTPEFVTKLVLASSMPYDFLIME